MAPGETAPPPAQSPGVVAFPSSEPANDDAAEAVRRSLRQIVANRKAEAEAAQAWVVENKLALGCHVRIVKGPSKRRTGIVMVFGQRSGSVLVGLDAMGQQPQKLHRFPRAFVSCIAPPDPPAPSAFVIDEDGAQGLELGDLWKAAAQKIRDGQKQEVVTTLGSKWRT